MMPTDGELMTRVARKDRAAFASFYDRHGGTVYGLAHRVTRDERLAEEVTQEAFLAIWLNAARFDASRGKPSSWLMTMTHHRAVDVVRREQRRHTESDEALAHSAAPTDVERAVLLASDVTRVRDALAVLTEVQRRVIELAYFEGRSQVESAAHLGLPLGTVKSRTHVALARLRERLDVAPVDPPVGVVRKARTR